MSIRLRSAIVCLPLLSAIAAPGQTPPPAPQPTPAPVGNPAQSSLDNVPPSLKLGLRSAFIQSRMPSNPTVVIVPDERSFIAAIGAWDFQAGLRYPVLIDDGSWAAHQAIARFVRAFNPKSVVRWRAPETAPAWPAASDAAARKQLIEDTAAKPWNVTAGGAGEDLTASLKKRWGELQFKPMGVVVSSPTDPAWPAALTLAAARGEPILWLNGPGTIAGYVSLEEADAFERQIEALAEASGWKWSALGDDLDAVTLCLNCSTKVFLGDPAKGDQRGFLAMTDLVGRRVAPATDKSRKDRWAWAGMIVGGTWSSAYSAMSAVFLRPETAWLFDGYDDTPPWNQWDATDAGAELVKAGLTVTVDDNLRRGLPDWRKRVAGRVPANSTSPVPAGPGGVNADLICVNTSGNADFFELKPGYAKPADVPILAHPAMVHIVHSWSASSPADVRTVAGRWLERGAYAYVGSVHEPYLQAFCPTPKLAQRLAVGLPWGVAPRIDNGDVWKINIFGDPLMTIGRVQNIKQPQIVEKPLPLGDAVDLQTELAPALKDKNYAKAFADLTLLGRDRDIARLLEAVLREDKASITPEAALAGLAGCYFNGDFATLAKAYAVAEPLLADEKMIEQGTLWDARDMLWHAMFPTLTKLPRDQADTLATALRAETLERDTGEAFTAVRASSTPEAAREVISRAAKLAPNETERKKIEQIGKQ